MLINTKYGLELTTGRQVL